MQKKIRVALKGTKIDSQRVNVKKVFHFSSSLSILFSDVKETFSISNSHFFGHRYVLFSFAPLTFSVKSNQE